MGSIKKQGITNTIISYMGIGIGFLNLIVLQPFMLSLEELGLTRILFSFTLLVGTLFPLGLNFLTIKFFPRFKNKENGHNGYFGLLLLFALIGYILVACVIFLTKSTITAKYGSSPLFVEYFYYVLPISFCVGFTSIITVYCSALFKTSVPSFLNDVYLRVFMAIIVTLYYLKLISFSVFIFLFASSYAIQLLVLLSYVKFLKAFSLKINWSFFKAQHLTEIFKYTLLLAFTSLASIGVRNIDILIVGSYLSLDAVAVYSLGMAIGTLIEIPISSLGRIADAKIADAIQRNDMRMVQEVYRQSVKFLILIGGILFILLYANINEAISFLPEKYHEAKWVVLIIGFSAFINMATGINGSIIFYSHKYVSGTVLIFMMIIISVLLNILLIPIYGIEGSAAATAIALVLFNLAKFFLIKNHFKIQPYDAKIIKIVVAVIICIGLGYIFPVFDPDSYRDKILLIAVRSAILVSTFVSLLVALKVFSIKELKNIKDLS